MTTMTIAPEGIMTDLIAEEVELSTATCKLVHEDGSVTVVHGEEWTGDYNPRNGFGETFAQLVSDSRDYLPLDPADNGIAAMRVAAEMLDHVTDEWELVTEHEDCAELRIRMASGWQTWLNLNDSHEALAALAYFHGLDSKGAMRLYFDHYRSDIAHYEHHWQVTGSSQSDWREGWGYVTVEDVKRAGFYCDGPRDARDAGKKIMEGELKEYRAWFAGEVYRAVHITPAGQEYAIGDNGGYYTGETLGTTEHCGGFIGYDNLADIGQQFTSSPVVEEEWV